MRKLILISMLVLTVGCARGTTEKEQIRSVKCDTVKTAGSRVAQSQFPGRVKAAMESNVAFRVAGQITGIHVAQGQYVRKGSVIARLDDRDYLTQLAATEAEYNRIKAEADRVIELYSKQSATPNDYDKAVYGLRQITAKLEAHRNALNDTRLAAPFDGYIQKKYFDVGETVGAGLAVVSLVSTGHPEIEINIPTADFIQRGDYASATATIDVFPDRIFLLELIGINQKANLNQLYTTNFRIKEGSQAAPGMTAMVTVNYKEDEAGWMQIPFTALSGDSVWRVENDKVYRKPVKVGQIKNNGTVLVRGLAAGELVVSGGTNALTQGQRIKILPAKSATNVGGIL